MQGSRVGVVELRTAGQAARQPGQLDPQRLELLLQVQRGRLAVRAGVRRDYNFLHVLVADPRQQLGDPQVLGQHAAQRRERPAQHVVAAAERAAALDRDRVQRAFDHAQRVAAAPVVIADAAQRAVLAQRRAARAGRDAPGDPAQAGRQRVELGAVPLQHPERDALGASRPDAGHARQAVDQLLQGVGQSQHGSIIRASRSTITPMSRLCSVILVLLASALPITAIAEDPQESAKLVSWAPGLGLIEVKDLDDPANPYKGQYGPWDYWLHENQHDMTDEEVEAWNDGEVTPGKRLEIICVDAAGYQIPVAAWDRQARERERRSANLSAVGNELEPPRNIRRFEFYGELPPEIEQGMFDARMEVAADYVPRIPEWLGQAPPLQALVLPTGEVVAYGELGTGADYDWHVEHCNSTVRHGDHHRYSADGKLLAKLPREELWAKLFSPDLDQILPSFSGDNHYILMESGYVAIYGVDERGVLSMEPIALFDYDGTPVPANTNPDLRDVSLWEPLYGREISAIYAIQQARGE